MMKGYTFKTIATQQEELINLVFSLMFETLWVSPYDQRRSHAAMCEFEQTARQLAVLLRAANFCVIADAELEQLRQATDRLAKCVERLEAESLFHAGICADARSYVRRIIAGVNNPHLCAEK